MQVQGGTDQLTLADIAKVDTLSTSLQEQQPIEVLEEKSIRLMDRT